MCNKTEVGVEHLVINLAPLLSRPNSMLENVSAHIAVKGAVELTGRRIQDIIEIHFGVEAMENLLNGGNVEVSVKVLTDTDGIKIVKQFFILYIDSRNLSKLIPNCF